ncbi:hypothetical protein [Streptomyces cellulosae]|uniref:Uncharacterized protein n=1 Tax=Streptomyces cellulosae TaxID=1968 RepID=A0ABW7Y3W2_STRCE
MTQSGQGEEPSAREAREGIVLPSDGGEPLLPGMTGGYGRPNGPTPPAPGTSYGEPSGGSYDQGQGNGQGQGSAHGQASGSAQGQAQGPAYGQGAGSAYGEGSGSAYGQASGASYGQTSGSAYGQPHGQTPGQDSGAGAVPAGGQAWGTPWGPGQPQAPAPQPGQGWPTPADQSWGGPEAGQAQPSAAWGATPEAASPSLPPQGGQPPAYGADPGAYGPSGAGASPQSPGHSDDPPTSYYLPPVGQGGPPDASSQPAGGGYGAPGPGAPLPPENSGSAQAPVRYNAPAGSPLPPADAYGTPGGAPLPPADDGATQYVPRTAGADEGATQYLPPVGPGALPPETGAESTQFLGRSPQGDPSRPGAGPLPAATGPDAEPTQYIAPVPGQQPPGASYGGPQGADRQPPAEFDNLFRGGPGAEPGPAAATQQLPLLQQPHAASGAQPPYGQSAQPSYAPPGAGGGQHGAYDGGDGGHGGGRGGRSRSRVPVIAAVGIGIAVLGIGAGALLAGGGGDDKGDAKNQPVSATAPATDGSASPSADPAEQQAVALDKLLADSGSSRTTVINSVESVKSCKNLGQAAKDLRGAAQQRTGLVTRLSTLSVDKLPDNAALTDALTKAWQASASADNHYAAWADQAAGKKGCKKGQARATGQTLAGNQASGTASKEKVKAARLWNAIARTYGLTQRQPTQL